MTTHVSRTATEATGEGGVLHSPPGGVCVEISISSIKHHTAGDANLLETTNTASTTA